MIMKLIGKRWGFNILTIWKGEAYKVGKGEKELRKMGNLLEIMMRNVNIIIS